LLASSSRCRPKIFLHLRFWRPDFLRPAPSHSSCVWVGRQVSLFSRAKSLPELIFQLPLVDTSRFLALRQFLGLTASCFCPATVDFPWSGHRWLGFSLLPSFSCSSRSQLLPFQALIHRRPVSFRYAAAHAEFCLVFCGCRRSGPRSLFLFSLEIFGRRGSVRPSSQPSLLLAQRSVLVFLPLQAFALHRQSGFR
jgi:hypothetical protein